MGKNFIEEFGTRVTGFKMPKGVKDWITRFRSTTADQIEWTLGWLPVDEIVYMSATGPYFLLMGLRSIQPYASYRVLRQLGRCQTVPRDEDHSTHVVEIRSDAQFPKEVVRQIWSECQYLGANTRVRDLSREQWAWLAKEKEYLATISKLEQRIGKIKFDSSLQAAEDEGEKKRLVRENEALRAQLRDMRMAAEMPVRSEKDEKLIGKLRMKVHDYAADLTKAERDLLNAQAKLAKGAEEQARLAHQLKQKYDKEVAILQKRMVALENEMVKQTKDFKAEREHCYALIYQLQESMQQLQDQNNTDAQVLEARAQQIGRLLPEKGVIRMRIKEIADYVVMKCHECEDMTSSMFFASVMTFIRQVMVDLDHLQEDIAHRPVRRTTDVPQAPGVLVEALMYF
ncbi:uncharacterized protein [Nicotiana tomentosiformis]|uniref:uncharacterized protein n=1 Tax=Nicotiana tomentosiformis TaxID=4098 RepID=UPI00388C39A6